MILFNDCSILHFVSWFFHILYTYVYMHSFYYWYLILYISMVYVHPMAFLSENRPQKNFSCFTRPEINFLQFLEFQTWLHKEVLLVLPFFTFSSTMDWRLVSFAKATEKLFHVWIPWCNDPWSGCTFIMNMQTYPYKEPIHGDYVI